LVKGFIRVHSRGFRGDDPGCPRFDRCLTGLIRLIRSLALMTIIKNLRRHSCSLLLCSHVARVLAIRRAVLALADPQHYAHRPTRHSTRSAAPSPRTPPESPGSLEASAATEWNLPAQVNARPRRDRASAERTGGRGVTRPCKDVAAVRENARGRRSAAPRPDSRTPAPESEKVGDRAPPPNFAGKPVRRPPVCWSRSNSGLG
jgi:hypothetical protein